MRQVWQSMLGLVLGFSILLTGCGDSTGDVSGTLFFATASGPSVRGADVEVMLVPATARFNKDLAALQSEIAQELELIKGNDEAIALVATKHQGEGLSLLRRHHARTTRTDANGSYIFKDVPIGRAVVLAEWSTLEPRGTYELHHVWFLPVEVKGGENRLDLSGSSARGAFCPRRWEPGGPCK
jgi:hypothetical protein